MSVRKMAEVWAFSRHSGTHLLMLLSIADFADDDGRAYPSVASLARKCRMKPRNAQTILAGLRESGELVIRTGEGPKGTNLYRIPPLQSLAPMHDSAPLQGIALGGAKDCANPLQAFAPKPSVNHHEPPGGRTRRDETTLKAYIGQCHAEERKPVPKDDPIFAYAQKVGIDDEMLDVAWGEFKAYWLTGEGQAKRKRDWPATFRKAVAQNRARLWTIREGRDAEWTTVGEQARRAAA